MNIAIWGLGISGKSVLNYLFHRTENHIFIINRAKIEDIDISSDIKHSPRVSIYTEEMSEKIKSLDQIIISPGVDPRNKYLKRFKEQAPVIGDIEYVARLVKTPIIGITGSNGKTTTVNLLDQALKMQGKNIFTGGNIGTPFADILMENIKYDFILLELSSFQLESIVKFRPYIAAILNFTQTHMERYDNFSEYKKAKLNIFKNMDNNNKIFPEDIKALKDFKITNPGLAGIHNLKNLFVVKRVLEILKLDSSTLFLQKLEKSFIASPFRMQRLDYIKSCDVYNDAKSTNFASTLSALESLKDKEITLILGGKLRDKKLEKIEKLYEFNFKKIFVFGEARDELLKMYNDKLPVVAKEKLEDVFSAIDPKENKTILFSPAFPSFDQFENYIDRGNQFNKLAQKL